MKNSSVTPPSKTALLAALAAFVKQRSGIDGRNYGDRASFMSDYRRILKGGRHFRALMNTIAWRESITAENIMDAAKSAFMGRLSFVVKGDKVGVSYCAGQYFPTEYRNAACAVLVRALWNYWRADDVQDIRKQAARELGRGIAKEWFN